MVRRLHKPRIRESRTYTRDPKKNRVISNARKKAAREGKSTKNITAASFGWKSSADDKPRRSAVPTRKGSSRKSSSRSKNSRSRSSSARSSKGMPPRGPAIAAAVKQQSDKVKAGEVKSAGQAADEIVDTASAYLRRGIRGMTKVTETVVKTVTEPAKTEKSAPEPEVVTDKGEPVPLEGFELKPWHIALGLVVVAGGAYGISKKL